MAAPSAQIRGAPGRAGPPESGDTVLAPPQIGYGASRQASNSVRGVMGGRLVWRPHQTHAERLLRRGDRARGWARAACDLVAASERGRASLGGRSSRKPAAYTDAVTRQTR